MAGKSAGRGGSRWRKLCKDVRARGSNCGECGQTIDYTLKWPDPGAFTVDHILSWHDHPHLREDPANLRACHFRCNGTKGKGKSKPGLGNISEEW